MTGQFKPGERFHLGPGTCLMAGMFFVVLGALMATTYTKMRPVLDAAGQQVFWESGRPRYEVDQWASFWNGWPSNVPIILALVFFLMAAVKLASGMWRSRRRSPLPHSRQESRDSL